ncbi:MAG: chloride channel protein [Terriglobales bacterium]
MGVWGKISAAFGHQQRKQAAEELGDFTTTWEVLPISALGIVIGILSAFVALVLLRLIGFFTNIFFYQRLSTTFASPANNNLGLLEIAVPVVGALIVGVMARYGSERIRGHGIPEAIEAILLKGGRVEPRVALLKPLSAAISIGSGGPFGAEGPIIMTGGAFGSMIAQFFHLTSAERRTLLVAGAAAGMSATFASPLAAVLLSVELLLFEWKPRSLVPVALASIAAAATRRYIIGAGPLFPMAAHPATTDSNVLLACLLVGVMAGALSALLTLSVYAAEDSFQKLPIHWMWWPAIGGVVVGIGGLIFPQALGVGYDTIGAILKGDGSVKLLLGVLLVKSVIWAVSLGSGTSGGVLAPLLMMGGAMGGLVGSFLPGQEVGFWPLISMGAILGGTMRSPFTGVVFAVELTHNLNVILPLLLAAIVSHAFTVLTLRRSILTEKVARRGYHLSREYAVDPLEILFVREVMRSNIVALPADTPVSALAGSLHNENRDRGQRLYPVIDKDRHVVGVVTRHDLQDLLRQPDSRKFSELVRPSPTIAYPDESLRVVVCRMAETGLTRFPVVECGNSKKLVGMVSLEDLLKARAQNLEAERRRERVLPLRLFLPRGVRRKRAA